MAAQLADGLRHLTLTAAKLDANPDQRSQAAGGRVDFARLIAQLRFQWINFRGSSNRRVAEQPPRFRFHSA